MKSQLDFPIGTKIVSDKGLKAVVTRHYNGGFYAHYEGERYQFWVTFLDFDYWAKD